MTYEGQNEDEKALSNINLKIYENEFLCILGPNGSGKSTLLRLIAKEMSPTSGSIFFRDSDIHLIPNEEWFLYIGRIYQNPSEGLANSLTVEENLILSHLKGHRIRALTSAYSKKSKMKLSERLEPLLSKFNIKMGQKVRNLSGGQRQLLCVFMLFLQNPGLILLDEPAVSLDPVISQTVIDELRNWAKDYGSTIVMVTHQIPYALYAANRIIILNKGKMVDSLSREWFQSITADKLGETYFQQSYLS